VKTNNCINCFFFSIMSDEEGFCEKKMMTVEPYSSCPDFKR